MKRSLTDENLKEIRLLYSKGFTKESIGEKFKCSGTTIALWLPIDNNLRKRKFYRDKKSNLCHKCNKPIKTHKRCKYCTILLHDIPCYHK